MRPKTTTKFNAEDRIWNSLEVAKLLVPLLIVAIASYFARDYFDSVEKRRSDLVDVRTIAHDIYGWTAAAEQFDGAIDRYMDGQWSHAPSPTAALLQELLIDDLKEARTRYRTAVASWTTNIQGNRFIVRKVLTDSGIQTDYEKLLHKDLGDQLKNANSCLRARYKSLLAEESSDPCQPLVESSLVCGESITNVLAQLITITSYVPEATKEIAGVCQQAPATE